ncbi:MULTISPECIES: hypothetical protein [Rhizobium]|uniref:hypothetical protein n=1 Tax=Rhizobium TaxID=379 RepID=UPI001C83C9F1|nr:MULTISPECIES: hypothetical protein [Rhizobium]MBX4893753.1 hypothetical protein [Rhizobium bangladeshense]MBX5014403.1 hypothetical protein [Rhizobium lentis]
MKGTVQIISGRLQGVRTVLHPRAIEVTPLEMRGRYLAVIVANMLILREFVRSDSIEVERVLGRTNSKWLALIREPATPPLAEAIVANAKMRIATIHPSLGFELHFSQSFRTQSPVSAVTALLEADRDLMPKNLARIGFAAIGLEAEPLAFKRMAIGLVAEIDQHKLLGNTIRYLSEVISGDRVSILEKTTCALEKELRGLPVAVPSWVEIPLPELSVGIADFGLLRMDATGFSSAAQSSLAWVLLNMPASHCKPRRSSSRP